MIGFTPLPSSWGWANLTAATERTTAPGFDVDSLAAYLGAGPQGPGPQNRITVVP